MIKQTPQKRVLFLRALAKLGLGVFVIAAILYGGTVIFPGRTYAATSSTINFQGRLEGISGSVVPDGYYNVQFNLYSASSGGSSLWTETYYDSNGPSAGNDNRVQVSNGYLTVSLGSQTAFPSNINWDQDLYLTMNIGGTAQTATPTWDGEMSPRLHLTGVPYAFRAGQLAQFNAASGFTSTLSLLQPTVGNQTFQVANQGAAGTYTLCVQGAVAANGGCAPTTGGAGYIQNQNAGAQATSNFWISGTGIANILQAATFDTPSGTTTLNIGTTNATSINLNQSTTVAAGKSLTISGGITSTRPSSPSEGMLYYDTTTKSLLVYANGKWQADRSAATKIVAMGTATGCTGTSPVASANPDSADYVVTSCTSAQTTINSAIAALPAGGGTVYLEEGTYIIDGQINLASNVTLAGAGAGTVLKLKDGINANINLLSASTVNRVTVRDVKLDGNSTNNTSGSQYGLYLQNVGSGSGSSAIPGISLANVEVANFRSYGVYLVSGVNNSSINNLRAMTNQKGIYGAGTNVSVSNSLFQGNTSNGVDWAGGAGDTFTGNVAEGNGGAGINGSFSDSTLSGNAAKGNTSYGIALVSGSATVLSGNTVNANASSGIYVGGTHETVSSNVVDGNSGHGIYVQSANNTVTNNTVKSNTNNGINLFSGATNTLVSGNKVYDNGGSGSYNGILVGTGTSNNTVTNNLITDTAGTGYAISISSGVTGTYLSGNTYSGTGATSISDSGTGTVYAGQADSSGNFINVSQGGGFAVGAGSASATFALQGGLVETQLPTPATPTVTVTGTAGSATYGYKVTALDGLGETLPSTEKQVTTGNATLSGTNYNAVSWTPIGGAVQYRVYRTTVTGGSPATTGLIGTVSGTSTSLNDTGLSASTAVPSANTTGAANIQGGLTVGATFAPATPTLLQVTGTATGSITAALRAIAGQTQDVLQIQNSGGTAVASFDGTGLAALAKGLSIGTTSYTSSYGLLVTPTSTGNKGILVKGLSGQTGDLIDMQNNSGNLLTKFNANGDLSIGGVNSTPSTSALQVQNSAGTQLLNVDTTANAANLVTNGSFEQNTTGFNPKGSGVLSRITSQQLYGSASLEVDMTAAGDGTSYPITLTAGQSYTVSVYAKSAGSFGTFQIGYAADGSNETAYSLPSSTVSTSGWTRFSYTFTPASVSGSPYLFFKQNTSGSRTVYLDAVQLETGANSTPYHEGTFTLQGSLSTPLSVYNPNDSSTALQVIDSTGSSVFGVNTLLDRVYIGNVTATSSQVTSRLYVVAGGLPNLRLNQTGTNNLLELANNNTTVALFDQNGNLQAPSLDSLSGTLSLGSTNATAINIGKTSGTTNIQTTVYGTSLFKPNSDSTTAFQVQNAANGYNVLTVDTSGAKVVIGNAGSLTGILQLANATGTSTAGLQAAANTAAYTLTLPNAAPGLSQCLQSGSSTGTNLQWGSCGTGSGNTTLQNAYDNSVSPATILLADAKNFVINAADTTTDPNILFNLQCATSCGSNGRFAVQNAGSDILQINPSGSTTMVAIGSSTNGMTFNSSFEPYLNGSARHTRKFTLAAEYPGASMTGDGTNNSGTMTSDNMTTSPFRNYYKWTTTQGTAQDYDIWVRVPLPSDFSALPSGQTICLDTYASATTANGIKLTLYDVNNAAVTLTTSDLTPTSASTWQNRCTSSITGGSYQADGVIVLDIKLTAPATSGDVRIGDISFSYLSRW